HSYGQAWSVDPGADWKVDASNAERVHLSHGDQLTATFAPAESLEDMSLDAWVQDLQRRLRAVPVNNPKILALQLGDVHPVTINGRPGREFEMLTSIDSVESDQVTQVLVLELHPNLFLEATVVAGSRHVARTEAPAIRHLLHSIQCTPTSTPSP
ncbi:MAG: hypothetical protein ACYCW6_29435, partial [Candidatus Xenobia bacterium]